jgi:hypothetical protein
MRRCNNCNRIGHLAKVCPVPRRVAAAGECRDDDTTYRRQDHEDDDDNDDDNCVDQYDDDNDDQDEEQDNHSPYAHDDDREHDHDHDDDECHDHEKDGEEETQFAALEARTALDSVPLDRESSKWGSTLVLLNHKGDRVNITDLLLDTGCETDILTLDVVNRLGLPIIPPRKARKLELGDGRIVLVHGTVRVNGELRFHRINHAPHVFKDTVFEVLPNSLADALIGIHTIKSIFPQDELVRCHAKSHEKQSTDPVSRSEINFSTIKIPSLYGISF